jgi:hypothetical protein
MRLTHQRQQCVCNIAHRLPNQIDHTDQQVFCLSAAIPFSEAAFVLVDVLALHAAFFALFLSRYGHLLASRRDATCSCMDLLCKGPAIYGAISHTPRHQLSVAPATTKDFVA